MKNGPGTHAPPPPLRNFYLARVGLGGSVALEASKLLNERSLRPPTRRVHQQSLGDLVRPVIISLSAVVIFSTIPERRPTGASSTSVLVRLAG